jgi:hypothetical protein
MVLTDLCLLYAMDTWDIVMWCAHGSFIDAMGSKRKPMAWHQQAPWTMARLHGIVAAQTIGACYWSMVAKHFTVGTNHGWYTHVHGRVMVLTDLWPWTLGM